MVLFLGQVYFEYDNFRGYFDLVIYGFTSSTIRTRFVTVELFSVRKTFSPLETYGGTFVFKKLGLSFKNKLVK